MGVCQGGSLDGRTGRCLQEALLFKGVEKGRLLLPVRRFSRTNLLLALCLRVLAPLGDRSKEAGG